MFILPGLNAVTPVVMEPEQEQGIRVPDAVRGQQELKQRPALGLHHVVKYPLIVNFWESP